MVRSLCYCYNHCNNSKYAQSDQGLHCPLQESLDTIEYSNIEQSSRLDLMQAQDDVNLTFWTSAHFACARRHFQLDMAQMIWSQSELIFMLNNCNSNQTQPHGCKKMFWDSLMLLPETVLWYVSHFLQHPCALHLSASDDKTLVHIPWQNKTTT